MTDYEVHTTVRELKPDGCATMLVFFGFGIALLTVVGYWLA